MAWATARAVAGTALVGALVTSSLAGTADRFWPIAPAGMFAFAAEEVVELRLFGHRADGSEVRLDAAVLGLDDVELTMQLQAAAGGQIGFDDTALLVGLARVWNERRPDDSVVDVGVVLRRVFLDRSDHHLDATMLVVPLDAPGTTAAGARAVPAP